MIKKNKLLQITEFETSPTRTFKIRKSLDLNFSKLILVEKSFNSQIHQLNSANIQEHIEFFKMNVS